MSRAILSAASPATAAAASFHHRHPSTSSLEPCSHLCFYTQLPMPSFSLKTHSKSTRASPIKAAMTSSVYVNTESFYDLLGISECGTLSEIKKAYKQLARKYHPDVSPPDRTEEYTKRFIQVREAYETLSDPETRALYDRDIARDVHLAFSAKMQFHSERGFHERGEWQDRWQSQLSELERTSMDRGRRDNMSWGARMRSQRNNTL